MSSSSAPVLKPPPLRPGDTIGIVAPAGAVDRERFEAGCEGLRRVGYTPLFHDSIFDRDAYFAGSVERRLSELHAMFARADVRAILCARGGYGCTYLLPGLDLDLIRAHPKLFIGHSDLTALLTYLVDATGLVTVHGPMLIQDFSAEGGIHMGAWRAATEGGGGLDVRFAARDGVRLLAEGQAEGVLYGGCLSILAASLGTPYEARTEGKLLFLEDIHARPYQVDRMLMQLKLAGKLEEVRGVIFGQMVECGEPALLQQVARRILGELGVPIVFGVPSGHVTGNSMALPFGVRAALQAAGDTAHLRIMEPATAATESQVGERAGG